MSDQAVIIDTALACAAGSLDDTWQQLMAGQSALTPSSPLGMNCHVGKIAELAGSLGSTARLTNLIRLGLGRLERAGNLQDCHLVVATTKGAADEELRKYEEPGHGFAWQVAEMIQAELDQEMPATTVSAACASGTLALIQAAQRISQGEAEQVLVVGIDLLSTFVLAGFNQLLALADGPCRPFDRERDGLCLGEGIGICLLTSRAQAAQKQLPKLAAVSGWGVACDASHITAPCRQASGLSAALRQAMVGAHQQVGGINAHGTGTVYNDAMEITALRTIWTGNPPPFHSVKGAIGHCLGAAGVIETCIAVRSLQEGALPPTVGLRQPQDFPAQVSSQPQALKAPSIMSCNSGFGGINAALLLTAT